MEYSKVNSQCSPNHSRTLKTDTPTIDMYILGEAHGLQHLRAEHTTVADFDPLFQLRMEGKNL
jgi:hypothetical protein